MNPSNPNQPSDTHSDADKPVKARKDMRSQRYNRARVKRVFGEGLFALGLLGGAASAGSAGESLIDQQISSHRGGEFSEEATKHWARDDYAAGSEASNSAIEEYDNAIKEGKEAIASIGALVVSGAVGVAGAALRESGKDGMRWNAPRPRIELEPIEGQAFEVRLPDAVVDRLAATSDAASVESMLPPPAITDASSEIPPIGGGEDGPPVPWGEIL